VPKLLTHPFTNNMFKFNSNCSL